jgi:hypothetical protein
MHAGRALLARARAAAHDTVAVVGTGKNVGKTVTVAALCDALARDGAAFGLCSIGRDGEAFDAVEGFAKPRLFLRRGALVATARALIARSPAAEIVELLDEQSALGKLAIVRVRAAAFFEVSGPPTAAALRRVVERLRAHGATTTIVDGAVDRIAALAGGGDGVIVATGAACGPTPERVAAETAAFVRALGVPRCDPARDAVRLDGALTAGRAAALVRAGERRQVVVRDPTRIALGGAFAGFASHLDLRCETPIDVVACTVAPASADLAFEPASFLRAVADSTGLPAYDVYASAEALPAVRRAS